MASLAHIPLEILQNILSYLNVLDSKGTPLIRHFNPKTGPDHIGITFHMTNPDISLFDAMRVCKTWRDLIFGTIFNEDVTRWTARQWQQEIDRFRTVERAVLIEMTRKVVLLWKNTSFGPEILGRSAFEGWTGALNDGGEVTNNADGDEAGDGHDSDTGDGEAPDGDGAGPGTASIGIS